MDNLTNQELAQEISARIGNSPIPFDSVYSIALQIYNELGGEASQFDSVYSILLEILPLTGGVAHIDDSSISTDSTWSSEKINSEISALAGDANSEIVASETIDVTFVNVVPVEAGEDGQYVIYITEVEDTLYKYENGAWSVQTIDANKLYFDTEHDLLYAYKSVTHKFVEVAVDNTIIFSGSVTGANAKAALNPVKAPGVYNVLQHSISAGKAKMTNWVLTVTVLDSDEADELDGKVYQKLEYNYTVYKRYYKPSTDTWTAFTKYYEGLVRDSLTSSAYYTWSVNKVKSELAKKQDVLTSGNGIQIDAQNVIATKDMNNYLSFTNVGTDTIYITCSNNDGEYPTESGVYSIFQYSSDAINWNNLTSGSIELNANATVYFRGKILNPTTTTVKILSFKAFTDSALTTSVTTGCINAGGDLKYMVDYEQNIEVCPDSGLYRLFDGLSALLTAPNITFKEIGQSGCRYLFRNCTNLVKAPVLPATKLNDGSYYSMFQNCTSLTTAPVLPATTIGTSCYCNMFKGCTSLTTAPELPSLLIPMLAYNGMFIDCTSLVTPPSTLPATHVGYGGYKRMFSGCTSLEYSPDIMVISTINYIDDYGNSEGLFWKSSNLTIGMICEEMFMGCSNLKIIRCFIKKIINETNNDNNFRNFTNGVAATGKFTKVAGAIGWETDSVNGIPQGWTVEEI